MAEQDNKNPDAQDKPDDKPNSEGKTFTQEDFDKQLSKTLADKEAKLEKKLQEKFEKELTERERLAKLSAEEKETEVRKKRDAETAERENGITLRENRAEARDILSEKSIPAALVDFVVDVDLDKTKENINKLEEAYLKAVEAGVNDKLKGQTPKDKTNPDSATPKFSGTTVI